MQERRGVFDAPQCERLDRAVRKCDEIIECLPRRIKALKFEVVHVVIHERRLGSVAGGALALTKKDALAQEFLLGSLAVEPACNIQFGCWREIDDVLHLCHHRNLIGPVWKVRPFSGCADVVAIEIGGPLLELRKVLNRAQRALRTVDLLVEKPAQAHRVEPEAIRLRPDIGGEMEGRIGVEIRVAVEASHAQALLRDLPVLGLIELFAETVSAAGAGPPFAPA